MAHRVPSGRNPGGASVLSLALVLLLATPALGRAQNLSPQTTGTPAVAGARAWPDLASLLQRTRDYQERLARKGIPTDPESELELDALLDRASVGLRRAGGGVHKAMEDITTARRVLAKKTAALRLHMDAIERSLAKSPYSGIVHQRLEAERATLAAREEEAASDLASIGSAIEDRDGRGFGGIRDALRGLVGQAPEERLERLSVKLRRWGAARAPQTRGVTTSNEGLTYVRWAALSAPMPQGVAVPAYEVAGATLQLEDTTRSSEVEESDDLLAKAQELASPAAIVAFVRNELRLEWYNGCLKGGVETLREQGGNDVDLATVTIALLRAQGVPTRYVHGTVELQVGKLADLMGLLDTMALRDYYASPSTWTPPDRVRTAVLKVLEAGGIPFEPITTGGRVDAVQLAHVWVEAYLPYGNYRGTGPRTGPSQWVPIDPGITAGPKYEAFPAVVEALPFLPGGTTAFVDAYLATPTSVAPSEVFRASVEQALQNRGLSYQDAQYRVQLRREELPFIPGSLPYRVAAVHGEYALLPDALKQKARLRVEDEGGVALDVTVPLHRLVGQRSELIYVPATEADADLVVASGGYWEAPAAIVMVKPVLRINGRAVAEGNRPFGLGSAQTWSLEIADANGTVRRLQSQVIAGNLVALGMGGSRNGHIPGPQFLEGDDDGPAPRFYYSQAVAYDNAWSQAEAETARVLSLLCVHPTATVTLYESQLEVEEVLGVRQHVRWKGFAIDAKLRPTVPVELASAGAADLFRLSGLQGSWLEQSTLSTGLLGVESVSTATLMGVARSQGVPILHLTPASGESLPPEFEVGDPVRQDVIGYLKRGYTVVIPARTLAIRDWTGTGYMAANVETGEAGYFLSGHLAGAVTVVSAIQWDDEVWHLFGDNQVTEKDVLDWNGNTPPGCGPPRPVQERVVAVTMASSSDLPEVQVGARTSVPLTVAVLASWKASKCVQWNQQGTCTKTGYDYYAAKVANAPVLFESWDGAQPALANSSGDADVLLQGTPDAVTARIHEAAQAAGTALPDGRIAPLGSKLVTTLADGNAMIWVVPDPVIGAGSTAILRTSPDSGAIVLQGTNEVMATVPGVRPHGSSTTYDLRLNEPFTVKVLPGPVATLKADEGTDALGGAAGGLEYPSPFIAHVEDAFGNMLGGEHITWNDLGAGGRFIDSQFSEYTGHQAKALDPSDISQIPLSFTQTTSALSPVQVSYIPPYRLGTVVVVATCQGISHQFRMSSTEEGPFYFAVKMDRETFTPGIVGTWFNSSIVATIFRMTAGGWVPTKPGEGDFESGSVMAETWDSDGQVLLHTDSTEDGSLGFNAARNVLVRPQYYEAPSGRQVTWLSAKVRTTDGNTRDFPRQWYAGAVTKRVELEFSRVTSVLDELQLPGHDGAMVTDRELVVTVTNPSTEPVFLKVVQSTGTVRVDPARLSNGLLVAWAAPGKTRIALPLARQGGTNPGDPVVWPRPGSIGFEVWGFNKTRDSLPGVPERLQQSVSVSHQMDPKEGLVGDAVGTAYVTVGGGWNCTYYIQHPELVCTSGNGDEYRVKAVLIGDLFAGYYRSLPPDHTCINNACAQCLKDFGPLPEGRYTISEGFLDPGRADMAYRLNPLGSFKWCAKGSRSGVMIHYGSANPSYYSTGCIAVLDSSSRDTLNRYGGGILEVKASRSDDFVNTTCSHADLGASYTGPSSGRCEDLTGYAGFGGP